MNDYEHWQQSLIQEGVSEVEANKSVVYQLGPQSKKDGSKQQKLLTFILFYDNIKTVIEF